MPGGMLPLNSKGYEIAYAVAGGAFVIALLVGLLPTSRLRNIGTALYPVATLVFLIVHHPIGLNFLAWFAVLAVGGVGWALGLGFGFAIGRKRRFAKPS
jgi:hypothetical protein